MTLLEYLSDINVTTVLIFLIILLITHTIYTQPWVSNQPPGPFAFPILGTLPQLGSDVRKPLLELGRKYGDVFSIYMGTRHVVVLNSYDVIKEAMVKYADVFSNRARMFVFDEITKGYGIISVDGDFWREQRRFTHTVLKDFGMGKNKIQEKIQEECTFYVKTMDEDGLKGPLDPHRLTQTAVANIITSVIFGRRYDYSDPMFRDWMEITSRGFANVKRTFIVVLFPFLRILNYIPFADFLGVKGMFADGDKLEIEYVRRISDRKKDFDPNHVRDLIEAYIKKMNEEDVKSDPNTNFTDPQLLQIVGDLFAAGTETSSTTLHWAIAYMIHNPDTQRQVQEEIDNIIGPSRQPNYEDRHQMPLTEACLLEIQRLGDIVPMGVPHETATDINFHGYLIPKGTMIMPNLNAVHMDERQWEDPVKFDPYRFLDKDMNVINRDRIMPFGIGRRMCLGEALARMELFIFFVSMLQHFTFTKPDNCPLPDLVGDLGITSDVKPFKVTVNRR